MKITLVSAAAVAVLAACIIFAGCMATGSGDQSQGSLHAYYTYNDDVSVGLGCYERVSGYVYNAGNTTISSASLRFSLVDGESGTIRDTKVIALGPLGAGESRNFENTLDGECLNHYLVELAPGM